MNPRLHAPARVRRPLLLVVPAAVAAWALAGLYGSLGPTLLRHMIGSRSAALGGLTLFALAAGGVGFGVVYGGGMLATARVYGFAVMALAALALLGVLVHRPKSAH